jgi:cell division protein ZapE
VPRIELPPPAAPHILHCNMNIHVARNMQSDGPLARYRALLVEGVLVTDPAQAVAAERLQDLWGKLRGYDPQPRAGGLVGRLLRLKPADWAPDAAPNGLYLAGSVGRGKSLLMDLFFETAQVTRRRRLHFHAFMQEVHSRIHVWRQLEPGGADPIPPIADAIAAEAALLCFDELQINDIADAMLLGRLFKALFARGVVVIATSNTLPGDLFAGKPGRDAFLPFIELLSKHLDLLVLDGARDWRRLRPPTERTWIVAPQAPARAELDAAFDQFADGIAPKPDRLIVAGRVLPVPIAAGEVARFSFDCLCDVALGAADYLALATHFHTLLLDDVPIFGAENDDTARRFITLIDALYDHRVKLIATAAAEPDALYAGGSIGVAFERTASRLQEMQTTQYLALPHLT